MVGAGDGAGVGMTLGVGVGNEVGTVVGSSVAIGRQTVGNAGVVVGSDGDDAAKVVGDGDGGVVGIGVGAEVGASTTTPPTTHSRAGTALRRCRAAADTIHVGDAILAPPLRRKANATCSIASHAVGSSKVSASTAVCLSGL